jgi:hypothetical protein
MTLHKTLLYGLVALLLLAPLPFGSVQPWASTALLVSCLLLGTLWIVWRIRRGQSVLPWKDPVLVAGSLLVLLGVAQMIPLPRAVLQTISPKAVELRDRYEPSADVMAAAGAEAPSDRSSWRPISLYPWGTRQATLKFIGYLLAALITLDLAASGFARRVLVIGLVGSGAFQALYGLAEYFSDRSTSSDMPRSTTPTSPPAPSSTATISQASSR